MQASWPALQLDINDYSCSALQAVRNLLYLLMMQQKVQTPWLALQLKRLFMRQRRAVRNSTMLPTITIVSRRRIAIQGETRISTLFGNLLLSLIWG